MSMTKEELSSWIAQQVSQELGVPASKIDHGIELRRYGLDSLQTVTIVAELEEKLDRRLDIAILWDHPTIDALSSYLSSSAAASVPAADARAAAAGRASGMQEAMWMLQQQFPGTYISARAFTLHGPLQFEALQAAFQTVMARHPLLRTSFHSSDDGLRVIEHEKVPFSIARVDGEKMSEEQLTELIETESNRPFDSSQAPLWRALLVRRADTRHVLMLSFSHLVFDAWSWLLFMHEVGNVLSGQSAGAPPPFHFSSWVERELSWLSGEGTAQKEFWRKHIDGRVPFVPIETKKPRTAEDELWVAGRATVLEASVAGKVRQLAESHDATQFQVLLAALSLVYRGHSGKEAMAITSSVDLRRPEHRPTVGPFINHVVIPLDGTGDPTVSEYLKRVKEVGSACLAHEHYPFDRVLHEKWADWRDPVKVPLLQIQCNFYNFKSIGQQSALPRDAAAFSAAPGATFGLGPLRGEPLPIRRRKAPFDLSLWATVVGDELHCRLEYRWARFDGEFVEGLLGELRGMLLAMAADPSQRVSALAARR